MEKLLASLAKHRRIVYPIAGLVVLLGLSAGGLAASGTLSGSTPAATEQPSAGTADSSGGNGGGFPAANGRNNIVQVINYTDGSVKSGGRDDVTHMWGPNVGPKNEAVAFSSCVKCSTAAIAIQIVVVDAKVRNFQPLNMAEAVNYQCSGCTTCAVAIQYFIQVSDPTVIPNDVRKQVKLIDAELRDLPTAMAPKYPYDCLGINAFVDDVFIAQLKQLVGSLDVKRHTETAPTTPGASPMASPSPSPTPSAQPTSSP